MEDGCFRIRKPLNEAGMRNLDKLADSPEDFVETTEN